MPLVGLSKNLSRHYKATGAWRVMKYKEGLTPGAKISPRVQKFRQECKNFARGGFFKEGSD